MSLSLIPTADRLAADGRVTTHAGTATKGESPGSDMTALEFSMLVDSAEAVSPALISMSRTATKPAVTGAADNAPQFVSLANDPLADILEIDPQPTLSFPTIALPAIAVPTGQNLPKGPLVVGPNSDPRESIDALPGTAHLNTSAPNLADLWAEHLSDLRPAQTAEAAEPTGLLAPAEQSGRPAIAEDVFAVTAFSAPAIGAPARPGPTEPSPAGEDQVLRQTALLPAAVPTLQISEPKAGSSGLIDPTTQSSPAANSEGAQLPGYEIAPISNQVGIIAEPAERQRATPGSMADNDPAILTAFSTATTTTANHSSALLQPARNPQLFAAYSVLTKPGQSIPEPQTATAMIPSTLTGDEATASVHPIGAAGPNGPEKGHPSLTYQIPRSAVEGPIHLKSDVQSPTTRPIDQPRKPVDRVMAAVTAEAFIPDSFPPAQIQSEIQRHDAWLRTFDAPQGSRATATHIASQVAQAASQTASGTTEITLNPKELGHVKLSMQAIDGTMFVAIAAERPETTELMRRHIDSLAQEFRALGYQDVSFSFAGRQGGNGPGPDPGFGRSGHPEPAQPTEASAEPTADRYIPRRAAAQTGGTGLDLRL